MLTANARAGIFKFVLRAGKGTESRRLGAGARHRIVCRPFELVLSACKRLVNRRTALSFMQSAAS
jgi:hypothetical protein